MIRPPFLRSAVELSQFDPTFSSFDCRLSEGNFTEQKPFRLIRPPFKHAQWIKALVHFHDQSIALLRTSLVEVELETNPLLSLVKHGEQSLSKNLFFLSVESCKCEHVIEIAFNIGHV